MTVDEKKKPTREHVQVDCRLTVVGWLLYTAFPFDRVDLSNKVRCRRGLPESGGVGDFPIAVDRCRVLMGDVVLVTCATELQAWVWSGWIRSLLSF